MSISALFYELEKMQQKTTRREVTFANEIHIFLLIFPVTQLIANVYDHKKVLITHKAPISPRLKIKARIYRFYAVAVMDTQQVAEAAECVVCITFRERNRRCEQMGTIPFQFPVSRVQTDCYATKAL
jgi:hypothetical protein